MPLEGSVYGGVEGRLIGIYLQDRPPRVIRAGSVVVEFPSSIFIFATSSNDLLDVLVGYPMELQEELPRLHVTLDKLRSCLLELFLLLGVHCLHLLSVLAFLIGLLYLVKSPQFLVVHYSLDHCLDRERSKRRSSSLVELSAEPGSTSLTIIITFINWPELPDEKIFVVHKFFIRGPQRSSFTLLTSFYRPLFVDIKQVELLHGRKVDHAIEANWNSGKLLFLSTFEPALELDLNGHRLVIWEVYPVWLAFDPRIRSGVPKPPETFESQARFLKYININRENILPCLPCHFPPFVSLTQGTLLWIACDVLCFKLDRRPRSYKVNT